MKKVLGFEKEKQYLLNNFQNSKLNNSIIISGQKGIGKKTMLFLCKDLGSLTI